LFNQAQALQRQEKNEEARKEQVVKQYPQTTAATRAHKFVSEQAIFLSAQSSSDAGKLPSAGPKSEENNSEFRLIGSHRETSGQHGRQSRVS
jgi:hypothetical protein